MGKLASYQELHFPIRQFLSDSVLDRVQRSELQRSGLFHGVNPHREAIRPESCRNRAAYYNELSQAKKNLKSMENV